jgi:23S rRNA U2552 (ribose-2'-O)-methylase RlmE/FtsJ
MNEDNNEIQENQENEIRPEKNEIYLEHALIKNEINYYNNVRIHKLEKTPRNAIYDLDIFTFSLEIKQKNENSLNNFWDCTYKSNKSRELYEKLKLLKDRIEPYHNQSKWDDYKKRCNPFEYVYSPASFNIKSVARYHPISRSFFKLWEILCDFNQNNRESWNIATLAEGPGGFMDCLSCYRNNKNDNIYGITLKPTNNDIPTWKKIEKRKKNVKYYKNFHIHYGNLYYAEETRDYRQCFQHNKADLITADGGFDYSTDFNHQEQQSYRMIFSEMIMALSIQKINGCFIIKIFDVLTEFTQKIIYILTIYYEDVYIIKPYTSRSANSEKYIYCSKFRGISENHIREWYQILNNWKYIIDYKNNQNIEYEIINLLGVSLPQSFIEQMENYNELYVNQQILNINNILELLENNHPINYYFYHQQIINAIWWCNKYYMKITPFFLTFI